MHLYIFVYLYLLQTAMLAALAHINSANGFPERVAELVKVGRVERRLPGQIEIFNTAVEKVDIESVWRTIEN